MLIDAFNQSGVLAKMGILIAFAPLVAALLYTVKPSERRLALLRPLVLAGLFAGLASFAAGAIAVLEGIAVTATPINWRTVALGVRETFAVLFIAFANLTIAWLLVALGMRRAA